MLDERRFRKLPRYAYCRAAGCEWTDSSGTDTEREAVAHVEATGHEARVVISQEIILVGRAKAGAS